MSQKKCSKMFQNVSEKMFQNVPKSYGGRSSFGRFALVLGRDDELVVGVVVVGVELLGVGDDAVRVDGEVVVADRVLDLGVGARIRIGGLDFEDRSADGDVFVDVVGLVVGQLELGRVVVHVSHADGQLNFWKKNSFNFWKIKIF